MIRPKIGILFVTSGWFRQIGLQSSNLSEEVEEIAEEIVQKLSGYLDPIYTGVLYSEEAAQNSALKIKQADVDGLLISSLMWCEDQILRSALKILPRLPIILWTCLPARTLPEFLPFQEMLKESGTVGALQFSGLLKRERQAYKSLVGYYRDEGMHNQLKVHTLGFAISKKLSGAKVGVLPFRCEHMSTTYVDEFLLRSVYGVELKYLEFSRFRKKAQSLAEKDIKDFKQKLLQKGYKIEVDEPNLIEGIKYALAMEKIIKSENINIFVMNDVIEEMHESFGLRPCLTNSALSESDIVVAMEADISAGMAMYILQLATGKYPLYTETFAIDLKNNCLLLGHAGYHDHNNRDPDNPLKIIPDIEYENSDPFSGAVTYFKYKPGPVTVINSVFHGQRLKWIAFEGESLAGPLRLEGNCHLFCQPKPDVISLVNRSMESGVSQHWIVVPGYILDDLGILTHWLNIEYIPVV